MGVETDRLMLQMNESVVWREKKNPSDGDDSSFVCDIEMIYIILRVYSYISGSSDVSVAFIKLR